MNLPKSLSFLNPGWWLLHIVGIGVAFGAGFFVNQHLVGNSKPDHAEHSTNSTSTAGEPAADPLEHAMATVLRPKMRQMLADVIQLEGALSQGDLERAATFADSIAGACGESNMNKHIVAPERLGPSFLEHDTKLHETASKLGPILRDGRRDDAISASNEMISACTGCHSQAPAASKVDLHALTSFAKTLSSEQEGSP